jgi:hypothetical protein
MKLSKRDKTLLAILGILAVFGGFWWFIVKPAGADLQAQRDQLTQIQSETGDLRDTVARLKASSKGEAARTADRLRLAKALPASTETPGVVVQLQRLADKANVELTSIKTNQYSDYGSIRATEFEVRVTGRFFDVDDFLYRMHRQVAVDEKDRPIVGGRLFATTSVDMTLAPEDPAAADGATLDDDDIVVATMKVAAFSSIPEGSASTATPAGTPVATAPTTTPSTTVNAPPAAAGSQQTTATPTSGGAQ